MGSTKFKLLFLSLNRKRITHSKKLPSRHLNRDIKELMIIGRIKASLNMISSLRDSRKLKEIVSLFRSR